MEPVPPESPQSPEPPESPVALAATDRPLPLRLATIEDERAPDGMACIGSFLGPKLVARCVVPPDAAAFLLERGLFAQPVRLALAAREEAPGLQCQLFALVDLPGDFFETPDEEEENASPWADSVPGTAYDRAIQEGPVGATGDAEDEEDEEDEDDEDEEEEDEPGRERQAAVFLGQIIRFDHDRKHPGDLALETMDVLRTIVQGDVSEVVDKVLEDLLGEAGPPS
ncbi:MAG TPA: hypothetical protein VJ817_14980 [Gemmatimonadales bacterium]|nr:hypothetical protein [Gemmatimonadales bacterium]